MKKYKVYYKSTVIGVLEINEEGRHKYTPIKEGVESVKREAMLIQVMEQGTDWQEPIPFFKNRLEAAERFSITNVTSHTDQFSLVMFE